jgi:hypothetical protein
MKRTVFCSCSGAPSPVCVRASSAGGGARLSGGRLQLCQLRALMERVC